MCAKKREGIVYSTNPDFRYNEEQEQQKSTPEPGKQMLYIWIDSKGRNGKTVTLIKGFSGIAEDLERLGGELKKHCGCGGSVKNGEIIIQGEFREKIIAFLNGKGYKT